MDRGLDTTFLVEHALIEHAGHTAAQAKLTELLDQGDTFVLVPQVLCEFVHVVTDGRRFTQPLTMTEAVDRSEAWSRATSVRFESPDPRAVELFHRWVRQHGLGRKRLLDTLWAATLFVHNVTSIVTSNTRDFAVFGCFDIETP